MALSNLDLSQVIRTVYDSVNNGLRVVIENVEIAIQLDRASGDNVYAYSKGLAGVATSGTAIDCTDYKRIAIYSVSPVGLVLSGSADNTTFISIDSSNATYILKDIAATQIKLTFTSGTVKYVLQA